MTVPAGASTKHLVFYRAGEPGGPAPDPAHNYLPLRQGPRPRPVGDTYRSPCRSPRAGRPAHFAYTVSGQYVSEFNLTVATASVHLVISQVGSSPPVALRPAPRWSIRT